MVKIITQTTTELKNVQHKIINNTVYFSVKSLVDITDNDVKARLYHSSKMETYYVHKRKYVTTVAIRHAITFNGIVRYPSLFDYVKDIAGDSYKEDILDSINKQRKLALLNNDIALYEKLTSRYGQIMQRNRPTSNTYVTGNITVRD